MNVREALRTRTAAMVVIPLVVIAIAVAAWQLFGGSKSYRQVGKAFYTDDDGVTWFVDSADKIMPFDHNGKEAVGTAVYVGADGKPFAAYVIRHTAAARQALAAAEAKGEPSRNVMTSPLMEAKAPRSATAAWIADTDPRFQALITAGGALRPVLPGS